MFKITKLSVPYKLLKQVQKNQSNLYQGNAFYCGLTPIFIIMSWRFNNFCQIHLEATHMFKFQGVVQGEIPSPPTPPLFSVKAPQEQDCRHKKADQNCYEFLFITQSEKVISKYLFVISKGLIAKIQLQFQCIIFSLNTQNGLFCETCNRVVFKTLTQTSTMEHKLLLQK